MSNIKRNEKKFERDASGICFKNVNRSRQRDEKERRKKIIRNEKRLFRLKMTRSSVKLKVKKRAAATEKIKMISNGDYH